MAHPDLDSLLNFLIEVAQGHLEKRGEFYPIAAVMHYGGQIILQAVLTDNDFPLSDEVVALQTKVLREKASSGEICAAGICRDVRVAQADRVEKSDALCLNLEHANGESARVFLPYWKDPLGTYRYGEVWACTLEPTIFL